MADGTQPLPQEFAGKRSACDRCRTQKLGCMRINGHPNDACMRCVRSQAECATTSSRRPGRPVRPVRPARSAAMPSPTATHPALEVTGPMEVDVRMDMELNVNMEETLDFAALDLPLTFFAPADAASFFWHGQNAESIAFNDVDYGLGDDRSPCMPILDHRRSASISSLPQKHHQLLFHIHQKLSNLLLLVQTTQFDLAEVLRVTCVHPGISPNPLKTISEPPTNHHNSTSTITSPSPSPTPPSSSSSSSPYNPLAAITTHSAEFLDLLRSIHSSVDPAQTNSPPTADLLTVLSCYILLLSIYDCILAEFLAQSTTKPAFLDNALQSAPALALGGLVVPLAPTLPAYLLLSLLNNQVLPIEMCLGLPEVFRTCEGSRGAPGAEPGQGDVQKTGLFGGPGGQALCMSLVQVEMERGVRPKGGALGIVAALREKRQRVLAL